MNYSALFKNLRKEVSGHCQYKQLDSTFRILGAIATIPFWISYGFILCTQYVYLFFFNCLASSNDYLEAWVKETKKGVNHATEAVIYFVTLPFIFSLRCILSVFSMIFYILWFFEMCAAYIATLGGIRWQPFISNASFDDDIRLQPTTNSSSATIVIAIGLGLLGLEVLFFIIGLIGGNYNMFSIAGVFNVVYNLFMAIGVPAVFKTNVLRADEIHESEPEIVEEPPVYHTDFM